MILPVLSARLAKLLSDSPVSIGESLVILLRGIIPIGRLTSVSIPSCLLDGIVPPFEWSNSYRRIGRRRLLKGVLDRILEYLRPFFNVLCGPLPREFSQQIHPIRETSLYKVREPVPISFLKVQPSLGSHLRRDR